MSHAETTVMCIHCLEWKLESDIAIDNGKACTCQSCVDKVYSARYKYLRERDLDTIQKGGIFAGSTPDNQLLSGVDLDKAIDKELMKPKSDIQPANKCDKTHDMFEA